VSISQVLLVTPHTLYITPDDHYSTNSNNSITLSQCLGYSEICFTSNSQLIFWSKIYNLKEDFIIENLNNVTVIGNYSIIRCVNSSVSIAVINVTTFVLQNTEIVGCSNNYYYKVNTYNVPTHIDTAIFHRNAGLHLHYCASVTVTNVSITVNAGTDGLVAVNLMALSALSNVLFTVIPLQSHNPTSDGLVIYYYIQTTEEVLFIKNFTYKDMICNSKEIQNVFYITLHHNKAKIIVNINDTVLDNLCNVRTLYYSTFHNDKVTKVNLMGCQVNNNTARVIKDIDSSMLLILP